MFRNGQEGLEWVRGKLAEDQTSTIAVAFWGIGAADALGIGCRSSKASEIRIICNLTMGGTNPHEIRKLLEIPRVRIEQSDKLHGKVYLFGDAAMVGSSNVSANGLSFEGQSAKGWDEANLVVSEPRTLSAVQNWIDNLSSRNITQDDLKRAEKAWKVRRSAVPQSESKVSITALLEEGESAFAGRNIYLTLTAGDWSVEAERAVSTAKKDHPEINAWEDWAKLPKTGIFVSFYADENGEFEYEDCYKRSLGFPDRTASKGKKSLQWCFKEPLPLGLKSPHKDEKGWSSVIAKVLKQRGHPTAEGAHFIKFEDLAEL